jgi:hypothetical protein
VGRSDDSASGNFPLYVPLYKGQGSLSGNLCLRLFSSTQADISLVQAAKPSDKVFPGGVDLEMESTIYPYNAGLVKGFSPGSTRLTGSEFRAGLGRASSPGVSQFFVLSEANKISLPATPSVKLTLKVVGNTGLFRGTFQIVRAKPTRFKVLSTRRTISAADSSSEQAVEN